jgi:LysM repeat protein
MRIRSLISVMLPIVLAVLFGSAPARAQVVGGGLLLNGSFEGEYVAMSSYADARVAPSWFPWWVGQRGGDAPWSNQRPQFESSTSHMRSGTTGQRYFTGFSTHQAGVLQQVNGVGRGDIVQFEVWARTWSSNRDHTCCSLESGLIDLRAGIDPTGGANPYASTVVWSDPMRSDDSWSKLSLTATSLGSRVTVFVFSTPKYPVRHNEVFLDDARLVVVGYEELSAVEIPDPTALENPLAVSEPFELGDEVVSGPLVYSIQAGDTLSEIAKQFEVDVADLADANGLSEEDTIYVGGQLIIPGLTFVAPDVVARYTVQVGDTFEKIAFAFNTTTQVLAQLNGIVDYRQIDPGTEILVPIEAGTGGAPEGLISHVVEPDDTLTRIGLRYDVPPQTIASANHLGNAAFIHPGQVLIIP